MPVPLIKVGLAFLRTASRPAVQYLLAESSDHPAVRRTVMGVGRLSVALTSYHRSITRTEAAEEDGVKEEAGKASAADAKNGKVLPAVEPSDPATPPQVANRLRRMGLPLPAMPMLRQRKARKQKAQPPPTEDELLKAGASLVVEMTVYGILFLIVAYEYHSAKVAADAKEAHQAAEAAALLHRIGVLEERVVQLEERNRSWFRRKGKADPASEAATGPAKETEEPKDTMESKATPKDSAEVPKPTAPESAPVAAAQTNPPTACPLTTQESVFVFVLRWLLALLGL